RCTPAVLLCIPPPRRPTLFPYTTLFRSFGDLEVVLHAGRDHIFEVMEDLKFKIGPKSFFQTNSEQALHLYQVAREFAGLTGDERSEEHTSELQSRENLVCRLLLEKKNHT